MTDKSAEDVRVPAVCECAHPHVDSLDPDDVPCLKCGKRVAA